MAPGKLLHPVQSLSFDSSSPLPFFCVVVVLPPPSTFQQVPGSQLLLALLQGWGWDREVLLAPCHRSEQGPEQPRGSRS